MINSLDLSLRRSVIGRSLLKETGVNSFRDPPLSIATAKHKQQQQQQQQDDFNKTPLIRYPVVVLPKFGRDWAEISTAYNKEVVHSLERKIHLQRRLLLANLNQVILISKEQQNKNTLFPAFTSCSRCFCTGTSGLFQDLSAWAHLFSIRTITSLIVSFSFYNSESPSGLERHVGHLPMVLGKPLINRASCSNHFQNAVACLPIPLS